MKKLFIGFLFAVLVLPGFANAAMVSKAITYSGTVTRIAGGQVYFRTSAAAPYSVEVSSAALLRKNGSPMRLDEILVGDKVEVKGRLWPDNSINASSLRDMTLYAHRSTFTGKISTINFQDSSFMLDSSGTSRLVKTNNFTSFKVNGSAGTFRGLQPGMSVTLKAVWERKGTELLAESVDAKLKMINITISGQLVMVSPQGFTVLADNVIYGVDLAKAKLVSKAGKTLSQDKFKLGHSVKVEGKHPVESPSITATLVRNLSLAK